jgi:hypothetical protein
MERRRNNLFPIISRRASLGRFRYRRRGRASKTVCSQAEPGNKEHRYASLTDSYFILHISFLGGGHRSGEQRVFIKERGVAGMNLLEIQLQRRQIALQVAADDRLLPVVGGRLA